MTLPPARVNCSRTFTRFSGQELGLLLHGEPDLDPAAWRAATRYGGRFESPDEHPIIG